MRILLYIFVFTMVLMLNYNTTYAQNRNFTGIDYNVTKAVNACSLATYVPLFGSIATTCQDTLYKFNQLYCQNSLYHDELSTCRHNTIGNFLKGAGYEPLNNNTAN